MISNALIRAKRIFRAKKLGINYFRMKSFVLPESIKLGTKSIGINLPSFPGINELFRDIILDDEYNLKGLPNREIKTVADIGANVGVFAIAARIAFPNSVIHCYEPNSDNTPHLNRLRKPLRLKTYKEAVSEIDGTCSLSKSTAHDTSARISNLENGEISMVSLGTVLNRFDSKELDLLKLDCEGSEFEILKDSTNLRKCKFITLEYHILEDQHLESLKTLLSNAGFQVIQMNKRNKTLGNILAKRNII